jgi:peroxiredoxin Q/BCP
MLTPTMAALRCSKASRSSRKFEASSVQPAPDFELPDETGRTVRLSDFRGRRLILYFYPKDDTPGCTRQACAIRDDFPQFEKLGITVLGVSVDSVKSHKKFSSKYALPFTLLADEDKSISNLYGVWQKKKMMGREYMGIVRTSFLIDPSGTIAMVYPKVNPDEHAAMVLADLAVLAISDE